jgi:hypothetical protein
MKTEFAAHKNGIWTPVHIVVVAYGRRVQQSQGFTAICSERAGESVPQTEPDGILR